MTSTFEGGTAIENFKFTSREICPRNKVYPASEIAKNKRTNLRLYIRWSDLMLSSWDEHKVYTLATHHDIITVMPGGRSSVRSDMRQITVEQYTYGSWRDWLHAGQARDEAKRVVAQETEWTHWQFRIPPCLFWDSTHCKRYLTRSVRYEW